MKTIIAGSRGIDDMKIVVAAIEGSGFDITEVVSGGAKGVDLCGELYAASKGLPVRQFLPDWDTYGKAAGIMRNVDMAKYADALISIWDGISRGSLHMFQAMHYEGKPIYQINTLKDTLLPVIRYTPHFHA